MASGRVVRSSAVHETLLSKGQMDWKIENFIDVIKAWQTLESPIFSFFFPEAKKTFKFTLKARRDVEDFGNFAKIVEFSLITLSSENVRISTSVKVGTWTSRPLKGEVKEGNCLGTFRISYDGVHKALAEGSLNICVKFSIFHPSKATLSEPIEFADSDEKFRQALRHLRTDNVLSDFTIECSSKKFPCHKAILANRSDVFARVFSSQDWIENKRNLFKINDHDPAIVEQMLEFVYTNKIPDASECSIELLLIADQFNLKDLVHLCESDISKTLSVDNAVKILNVADKVPEASRLQQLVLQFVAENILAVVGTEDWKNVIDPDLELLKAIKNIKL